MEQIPIRKLSKLAWSTTDGEKSNGFWSSVVTPIIMEQP